MPLLLALTRFQHTIDGFRNRDLRQQMADLLGVMLAEHTAHQTCDCGASGNVLLEISLRLRKHVPAVIDMVFVDVDGFGMALPSSPRTRKLLQSFRAI